MKAANMTDSDVQLVRLTFADMSNALAAGNVDAYVGSEPGPSIDVLSGRGRVLLYPYNTPVGQINVTFCTHSDLVTKDPAYVRSVVKTHCQAMAWAGKTSSRPEFNAETTRLLGADPKALDMAMNNITFDYMIDADYLKKAQYYGQQMITLKEIAKVPDYATFINTSFLPK
jgi:NitT/TauT family transport system substrate-binding protein